MPKNKKNIYTNIIKAIGSRFPSIIRDSVEKNLIYADIDADTDLLLASTLIFSIISTALGYLISINIWPSNISYILIATSIAMVLPLFILTSGTYFMADARTKEIERLLPDALNMIASNIEGGMTPYNAIVVASRPEFGPLTKEFLRASNRTMAGAPFYETLIDMSKRINSATFNRTVKLLVTGMKSGGDTVKLLRDLSLDIREFQKIRRAVVTAVMSNTMFIGLATTFGAPALFAVSMILLGVLAQMGSQFSGEEMAALPIPMVSVEPEILKMMQTFAYIMIFVSAISSGAMIGLIKTGKVSHGIKYSIPMMVIGMILFSAVKDIASSMFGM